MSDQPRLRVRRRRRRGGPVRAEGGAEPGDAGGRGIPRHPQRLGARAVHQEGDAKGIFFFKASELLLEVKLTP